MVEVLSTIRPYHNIELSSTERGIIREILVKPGDDVKAGQILLKLNDEVIAAQLEQARVQARGTGLIATAEAGYKLAKSRFEIVSELNKRGTANEAEFDREQTNMKAREGELTAAKEAREVYRFQEERMEAELEQRYVRTPIAGTVVDITKEVSEPVGLSTGAEPPYLVRVVNLDQLSVKAHVPYANARLLKLSQMLSIRLEDGRNTLAQGKIEFLSPVVDPATGTVEVRLIVENRERQLMSGVPARVWVPAADFPK